eukprot:m.11378 g.11378  ORF g.11378 m.11378 type:complete len:199 (+) comp6504_c0_seq1:154-750(+)
MAARPESFKLVLLGASGVGKSSLVLRFVRDEFRDHHEITVGAAFLSKVVKLNSGRDVKLEIWDTAGQERYRSLAPMYYRGAQAAVVVYDITYPDSFTQAQEWIRELRAHTEGLQNILVVLAGNKVDQSERREVSVETVQEYAQNEGIKYMETSALASVNTTQIFEYIAEELAKNSTGVSPTPAGVDLQAQQQARGGCC